MEQVQGNRYAQKTKQAGEPKRPKGRANRRGLFLANLLIVPFLLFLSLLVGLMIGYSVIGDRPVSEVFDLNTYKHMYDLIFQGT
ncbi:MAG: DNA-directed RNA polymerase subunit beta [Brevibacillus sp.]|nr:DNA-directed RNA polymerase subunit beta [Brevibacillus sp.]